MLYVYRGSLNVGKQSVKAGHMAMLTAGEQLTLRAEQPCGSLLLMGQPSMNRCALWTIRNEQHG